MVKTKSKRLQKKASVRKKIFGTPEKPRMSVFRSLNEVYIQLIDDVSGKTLVAASSLSKEIADQVKEAKTKTDKSAVVGEYLAKVALDKDIKQVVFDRNGYRYHGRVKAVADGARKGGLVF
ncbi:MAG: 50S ribosomal protein L18 [Melioribacteraceae bacterium]|nr:MAG: 50S ribosomal protein L18 [Melioribacteraceae bacterium]